MWLKIHMIETRVIINLGHISETKYINPSIIMLAFIACVTPTQAK